MRIEKSFRKRPLKRVVPKIRGEPAAGLFHDCCTAEDILTDADSRRVPIEEFRWNRPHQIFQTFDQAREFLFKVLNDLGFGVFNHESSRAPRGLLGLRAETAAGGSK